jgi:hypothetical protein
MVSLRSAQFPFYAELQISKFSSHKAFFLKTASTCLSSMYGVKQKASYNITLGKIGFFLVIPPTCYFFI